MSNTENLFAIAVDLLKKLIATPSISKDENETANILALFFANRNMEHAKVGHNVFAKDKYFDDSKPTLLLNSHHDTVKPNPSYTLNPYEPIEKEGKLYGLGSNDAGASLVCLLATFLHFYDKQNLPFNLYFVASAEEEISGAGGIEMVLPYLSPIAAAIVGEPTEMQLAIAERGLMVIDAKSTGIPGHAARQEGTNAIYKAMQDIAWLRAFSFPKVSPLLNKVTTQVTVINTPNKAHNVVPDECDFVIDVRVNELYSFSEVLEILGENMASTLTPRSTRLKSSIISLSHPLVQSGLALGLSYYGSPTTSDKALMPFPALKMGPGHSSRSHSADEYIYLAEIEKGIETYIQLISDLKTLG